MSVSGTVWLVGMMGAGKSTVGPVLARRMGRRFVDLDAEIERLAGAPINQIFEREGEEGFRRRERAAIRSWAGAAVVVALGGGAIAQPGAPEALRESGVVVYLRVRLDTLMARLGDCDTRPMLRDLDPQARRRRVEALLEDRGAAYESATVRVDVDDRNALDIARRAHQALEEAA